METPNNFNEAVEALIPRFAGADTWDEFKQGEDFFAAFCHSQLSGGIGMQIRNQYGLWEEGTPLREDLTKNHNCEHPDDMSDLLIREVYRRITNGIS